MKDSNQQVFIMVPEDVLKELREGIEIMKQTKGASAQPGVGDYISEKEAKEILGRKTTWFWSMRTKGHLSFTKIGNKVFYRKIDIERLLDTNRKEAFRKKN